MKASDFSNAPASFKRANPHLFRGVEAVVQHQSSQQGAQLECNLGDDALRPAKDKKRDSRRFLVRVISVRKRLIDEDNLCEKYHVDCLRYAGLLPGDDPTQTRIETFQRKPEEGEDEGTILMIFEVCSEPQQEG
ncbi:MAG: hypothetical protein ACOYD4_04080 [Solirubrobacterales bacterium]